ncbi:phosphomannomutase [Kiloniella litopenaei]|uniref:Phosphomannomutase n=1 Tax=Kiloniella litopenaei TaxID=1549748 RepID=A0A0M2RFM2_9PROT|nr:phosphomannomutase/phosphoglucomutase [Kiloniella litopenaei]KKJ78353.1 phosphomannomutase [Kiloniella litopenaei]
MYNFDPTIIREYDIRGIIGETLSADDATAIGRAFGTIIRRAGGDKVAVGYDGRTSSPGLADALTQGLRASGVTVYGVGRGPTPMLYFAAYTLPVDGGIMITGSHNPGNHNGFKLVQNKQAFFGEQIKEIDRVAKSGNFEEGDGDYIEHPIFDAYIGRLLGEVQFQHSNLKVVWDAGNGAAGEAMTALTSQLPGQHELLFAEIDGTFPNHHPDPTVPENLVDLQRGISANNADLGIAFDGDGDRIGLVDSEGEILWGDQIMLFLAKGVLKDLPGATIIADVKASQVLFDEIEKAGGKPVMWKTGHSHIKSKMIELKAPFAGEMSAHLFFADRYYGYDDALYAAVRVLNILETEGLSLAEFRKSLPKAVNTPEMRFECDDTRKFAVVDEVAARLAEDNADVVSVDGVRVNTADGWWLLRASNTQAVLVARCEASTEEGLGRLQAQLAEQLSKSDVVLPN